MGIDLAGFLASSPATAIPVIEFKHEVINMTILIYMSAIMYVSLQSSHTD